MKQMIVLIYVALLLNACSMKILLPYEEEPSCKRGQKEGMCGSVSEIYKTTTRINYGD